MSYIMQDKYEPYPQFNFYVKRSIVRLHPTIPWYPFIFVWRPIAFDNVSKAVWAWGGHLKKESIRPDPDVECA